MAKFTTILGIETSCDETSAAVLREKDGRINLLSNIIASSSSMQEKFGGVIPEQAAREQLKSTIPVIDEALTVANVKPAEIDAIATTFGPGLIGSLLVGVETAKTLALTWNKPLLPINHLIGHLYANWIYQSSVISSQSSEKILKTDSVASLKTENSVPTFPCLGLLVSGGHTDLVYFTSHGKYEYLGGTRDDAAGECFDKCARLLGYPYPGGPKISKLAEAGNPDNFILPKPMKDSADFDFSFSGLKTAFSNLVKENFIISEISQEDAQFHWKQISLSENIDADTQKIANLCCTLENTIIETLLDKTLKAAKEKNAKQLIVAGGVAANKKLINTLKEKFPGEVFCPPPVLCTDNAAMIASAAFFTGQEVSPLDLQANPNLTL